jgi:hypothetical protein
MAPLLRGVLTPGLERGESVSRFWEEQFGWLNGQGEPLDDRTPWKRQRPDGCIEWAPVTMFNTCDVERGARLIIGFPPLPPGLIGNPLAAPAVNAPVALSDYHDSGYGLRLAEAVRLSANFPWGFEVATLKLKPHRPDGVAGPLPPEATILALDGGIVDNSGIDSIAHLIQALRRNADEAHRKAEKASLLEKQSLRLLERLRDAGVIVIQIDSGSKRVETRMADFSAILAHLAPALFRPLQALNNTSYTNADLATLDHDIILRTMLDPDLPWPGDEPAAAGPAGPSLYWRYPVVCNHDENVMTAWALGPTDKAQVLHQFLVEWETKRAAIAQLLQQTHEIAVTYRKIREAGGQKVATDSAEARQLQELGQRTARLQQAIQIEALNSKAYFQELGGPRPAQAQAGLPASVVAEAQALQADDPVQALTQSAIASLRRQGQERLKWYQPREPALADGVVRFEPERVGPAMLGTGNAGPAAGMAGPPRLAPAGGPVRIQEPIAPAGGARPEAKAGPAAAPK